MREGHPPSGFCLTTRHSPSLKSLFLLLGLRTTGSLRTLCLRVFVRYSISSIVSPLCQTFPCAPPLSTIGVLFFLSLEFLHNCFLAAFLFFFIPRRITTHISMVISFPASLPQLSYSTTLSSSFPNLLGRFGKCTIFFRWFLLQFRRCRVF